MAQMNAALGGIKMNEAKIFKFSGYAVDSIDPYSKDQVKDSLYDWADDQSFRFLQHVHVEEAVLQEDDLDDLSVKNCDLSHCEKYFQSKQAQLSMTGPFQSRASTGFTSRLERWSRSLRSADAAKAPILSA